MKSYLTLRDAFTIQEGRDAEALAKEKWLALVRQHSGNAELRPEEFHVRSMWLCNSKRDHYYSRFSMGALLEVAELLPGRPVMIAHDYRTLPVGRFFRAERVYRDRREPRADSYWVRGDFFVPKDDHEGDAIVRRIDMGIFREVSIGWRCVEATCTLCGNPINDRNRCVHIPGAVYESGICDYEFSGITAVLEGSLVFAGGQKDTSMFDPTKPQMEEPRAASMTIEEFAQRSNLDTRIIRPTKGELVRAAFAGKDEDTDLHARDLRERIQAVVCMKDSFPDSAKARTWVRDHEFKADAMDGDPIHGSDDSYRFVQFKDDQNEFDVIAAGKFDPGVRFIVTKKATRKAEEEESRTTLGDLLTSAR